MSTPTPICVKCQLEMRCIKNNRPVADPSAASGPSTYWLGDEYECPECHNRIVTGFGAPMTVRPTAQFSSVLHFDYERPVEGHTS